MIKDTNYKTIQNLECLSASLCSYFMWDEIMVRSKDIILLGDGFNQVYDERNHILGSEMFNANERFLKKYDVKYKVGNCRTKEEAEKLLNEAVRNSDKIILNLTTSHLNYNRVFKQSKSSPHYINIIGQDEDMLMVSDGYVPTMTPSTFEGWFSKKNIMLSWAEKNYRYIILGNNRNFVDSEFKESVHLKMIEGCKNYLNGGISELYSYGIDAVANSFKYLNSLFGKDEFSGYVTKLNYYLRVYGFLTFKRMLLEHMVEIGCEGRLCVQYEENIQEWNKLLLLLVKLGISKNEKVLNRINEEFHRNMVEEEKILRRIVEIYG